MNRKVVLGGTVVGGAGLIAKTCARRGRDGGCAKRRGERIARMIEQMPDDSPPKWMFNNITAIRENTDRILQLLEPGEPTAPAVKE